MNLRPRRRPVPAIPIVSLIDIMVILLIFFIATTTFNDAKKQVKIALPTSDSLGETAPAQEVRKALAITEKEAIFLDNTPVEITQLADALIALKKREPALKLELQADKKTSLGLLLKVWDALRKAGHPVNDVPARILGGQEASGSPGTQ